MGIIGRLPEILERSAGRFGKPILVHYHIYKNAGTSVEKNLAESYGHKWAVCEGAPEQVRLSNNDIAAFARANPGIRAISSHKARPFPASRRFFPILFLRHPIDRARSVYSFAKRDPAQPDHAMAYNLSFNDYVNWALDTPGVPLRNYQVIHLSQASFRVANIAEAVACPEDLREVRDFLSSLPFLGLVRRFEEFLPRFRGLLWTDLSRPQDAPGSRECFNGRRAERRSGARHRSSRTWRGGVWEARRGQSVRPRALRYGSETVRSQSGASLPARPPARRSRHCRSRPSAPGGRRLARRTFR